MENNNSLHVYVVPKGMIAIPTRRYEELVQAEMDRNIMLSMIKADKYAGEGIANAIESAHRRFGRVTAEDEGC